jgi:hypothetical protein
MGCGTRRVLGVAQALLPAASTLLSMQMLLLAQGPNNVNWSLTLGPATAAPGSKVVARLEGKIDPGWHLYSMTTAAAIPTTVKVAANAAVDKVRVFQAPPKKSYDPNFQMETETYEGSAVFVLELQLKPDAAAGASEVSAEVR